MDKSNSDKALDDLAAGILTSWQETTKNKAEAYKNLMAIGGKAAEAHELANDDRSYGKWVKALCARSSGLTAKIVKASKWCADNRAKADAVKAWLEAAGKEVGAPLTIYNAHGAWRTAMALKGTEEAIKEADLSTEEVDAMQAKARDREVKAEANRQALVIKVPVELKANPLIADLAAQLQAAIEAPAGSHQPRPEPKQKPEPEPEPTKAEKSALDRHKKKLELGFDARAEVRANEILRVYGDEKIAEAERKIEQANKALAAARFKVTAGEFKLLKMACVPERTLTHETALEVKAILERIEPLVEKPRPNVAPLPTLGEMEENRVKADIDKIRSGQRPAVNWEKSYTPNGDAVWQSQRPHARINLRIEEAPEDGVKAIWVGQWSDTGKYTLADAKKAAIDALIRQVTS